VPPQDRRSLYSLVSFTKPPVAEVALSVQFSPETVDVETFGLFAHKLRDEFPNRQRQPALPPMSETFDQRPGMPSINIQFADPASMPRLWMISQKGTELVQLQHDRLTYNWRQLDAPSPYPRYKHLRRRIADLLDVLTECIQEAAPTKDGTSLAHNMCEVAYVNPVEYGSKKSSKQHPDLARIISRIRAAPKGDFLSAPEDAQFQARWRIPASTLGREGGPVGRLHLSALPALKPPDQTPIYMINLTARVIPSRPARQSALKALDVGHEWAVLGFKDVTTQEVQQAWGIKEEGS
jgi:uncharacterized protein (TIGR04255 family)